MRSVRSHHWCKIKYWLLVKLAKCTIIEINVNKSQIISIFVALCMATGLFSWREDCPSVLISLFSSTGIHLTERLLCTINSKAGVASEVIWWLQQLTYALMSSKVISVAWRMESTTLKKICPYIPELPFYQECTSCDKCEKICSRFNAGYGYSRTVAPPLYTCTCALRKVRLRLTFITLKILLEPEWPINIVQTLRISGPYIKEPTFFVSGRSDCAWLIDLFRYFFRNAVLIFHQVARCLTIPNLSKMEITIDLNGSFIHFRVRLLINWVANVA